MSKIVIKPVVVIPVYKNLVAWDENEIHSFRRCISVLKEHPIYLIGPTKLNWKALAEQIYEQYDIKPFVAEFDNVYFANIEGYNKLLKSSFFYSYFKSFSHLLIYQLDAFVFKDELIKWCKKGYDYIGAPWLEGFTNNKSTTFLGVGNGGFSLHNINSALKVLPKIEFIHRILELGENGKSSFFIKKFVRVFKYSIIKRILGVQNLSKFERLNSKDTINEDYFWGVLIPSVFNNFKVANIEDAFKFSFEVNPKMLYKMNNNTLPFGCHAWMKYEPEFWHPFIINPPFDESPSS